MNMPCNSAASLAVAALRGEYQVRDPRTGVGSCALSDGARYQVHVGD